MSEGPPLLAITGATASGKTALSIEVALRLDGEIISMDSRQVYRGMDIGTAKPSAEQRARVPHHGLDLIDPDVRFSAARWGRYARDRIEAIQGRGRAAILTGGTGFFLRALTHPIFGEPPLDADRRATLQRYLSGLSDDTLRRWLLDLDPVSGARLSRWGGRQRLQRALELPLLTGRSLTWWQANSPPECAPLIPAVFVLDLERPVLDRAIDRRVDEMVSAGFVEEVAALRDAGYGDGAPGMKATGYGEILAYLRGETTLEEALDKIRRNTRAYARRQLTWLKHQLPEGAVWLDAAASRADLVETIAGAAGRPSAPGEVRPSS